MKGVGWVIFIFFVLVLINYGLTMAGGLFTYNGFAAGLAHAGQSSDMLSSIDFSLFSRNGAGRSFITQGYGHTPFSYAYIGDWHNGIDIAASYGAPIYAPGLGTVIATGNQDNYCPRRAFGKFVVVDDTVNHVVLLFAHLGTVAVSPGNTVSGGMLIGTVGATGYETGTHLHFSIYAETGFSMAPAHGCGPYPQGNDVDPLKYLGTTYQ